MDGVRYLVSPKHNNASAYRQFLGKESRTTELGRRGRIRLMYLYARTFLQRNFVTRDDARR